MSDTQAIIAQKRAEIERVNLAALKGDIKKAREWARAHFPGATVVPEDAPAEEWVNAMFSPAFDLAFPDADRMTVTPVVIGQEMTGCESEFRLVWERGGLWWVGDICIRRDLLGVKDELRHYVGRAEGKPS